MFWDFYLPDQNIVIEFNGEQHYRYTEFFWSDYDYYEKLHNKTDYFNIIQRITSVEKICININLLMFINVN